MALVPWFVTWICNSNGFDERRGKTNDQLGLSLVVGIPFLHSVPSIAGRDPNCGPRGTESAESHQRIDYQARVDMHTHDRQQHWQPQEHGHKHCD